MIQLLLPIIEWLPINCAPKDCTWIEAECKDGSVHRVHYACGDGDGLMPPFDGWFEAVICSNGQVSFYREVDNVIGWRAIS